MKIGIITMHRVKNIGSVLQAYATQKAFEQCGYYSELIDYAYAPPNRFSFRRLFVIVQSCIFNVLLGFPKYKYERRIGKFYSTYFKCSEETYNQDSIVLSPPIYDIYCTGSDQVWNPRYIDKDTTFMLGFVPEGKKKISYASSFATDVLPAEYENLYSKYLSKYNHISVREQGGVELIRSLTGKNAKLVCDPTLLLDSKEWDMVSRTSEIHIESPYILVYFLGYMFDPRPYLFDIVNDVQSKMKLQVIYLNGGHQEMRQPHSKVLRGLGPAEFINLIKHASFVITDSFHGTAFATIYNKPMMGIVKSVYAGDDRIGTLRKKVCGSKSIVQFDSYMNTFQVDSIDDFRCDSDQVIAFRTESLAYVKKMIEK